MSIGLPDCDSIEAYHYELRGRQLALELTKPYLVLARRMFAKAIELDPGYARAYAGMVLCDCYLCDWHGEDIGLPFTDGDNLLPLRAALSGKAVDSESTIIVAICPCC